MRLAVSRFFEVRGQPIEALGKLEQFSADFREPRLAHNMPDFLRGPTVVSGPALLVFGHRAICPRDTKRQPGPQVPSASGTVWAVLQFSAVVLPPDHNTQPSWVALEALGVRMRRCSVRKQPSNKSLCDIDAAECRVWNQPNVTSVCHVYRSLTIG